ncbi:MAG TPA: TonB-dependent receptor [Steroidobacteraceae bacterium]|jgi:outer membrane receptor protein involved in Fe transport
MKSKSRSAIGGAVAAILWGIATPGFAADPTVVAAAYPIVTAAADPIVTAAASGPSPNDLSEVTVTASRLNLLGTADTASQGSVTEQELDLRPAYRVGQLLESVPGLVVTVHSGEGKANQYLARGFNLDHGTDIANFVDDMPINRPTNTHGQGYSDLNFMMPEFMNGLDYTKGPYHAEVGDFGSVASTHVKLANEVPDQVAVAGGTLGVYNVFLGGTDYLGDQDRVAGGIYYGHVDGPYTHPDDFRKIAGTVRYSHGTDTDGYNATAMFFHGAGNMTTDQPLRAVQEGLISRWGTLDPTDGNLSQRYSLSGHYAKSGDDWKFNSSAYFIRSTMTLWNDFTHYLDDPTNGDQEQQYESRSTAGGQAAFTSTQALGPITNDLSVGLQLRYDTALVLRKHTLHRAPLDYCSVEQADGSALQVPTSGGICNADNVHLLDLGPYLEDTTHWTSWFRTVVGLREEYYRAGDSSLTTGFQGSTHETLFQPKGTLIFGPFAQTEVYLSAGRGFHSDDVRGVFGTVPIEGVPGAAGTTPLLAPTSGLELGIRSDIIPKVSLQFAVFQQDFDSELTYNADAGQDEASAPSRRQGIELSGEYRPLPWIEFNSDLAFSKARYRDNLDDFGLDGPFIANAPKFIGSFGVLVNNFGPWSGGLQWRKLGGYPISDGDEFPEDKGYSEFNLDVGYKVTKKIKVQLSVYNLFNTKANSSAYYYAARLPGEPEDGVNGFQVHPLEPISGVLKVTATF